MSLSRCRRVRAPGCSCVIDGLLPVGFDICLLPKSTQHYQQCRNAQLWQVSVEVKRPGGAHYARVLTACRFCGGCLAAAVLADGGRQRDADAHGVRAGLVRLQAM